MKSREALEGQMQRPRAASAIADPNNDDLAGRAESFEQLIARRAYRLFEERGYLDGYDLEDWLQAESEILPAISVSTYEFEDNLITRAQLPLLSADEIDVQVEERRIVIADKLPLNLDGDDDAQPRRRIFRTVALPEPVDWANAATKTPLLSLQGLRRLSIDCRGGLRHNRARRFTSLRASRISAKDHFGGANSSRTYTARTANTARSGVCLVCF
jgi:hypothetical protein